MDLSMLFTARDIGNIVMFLIIIGLGEIGKSLTMDTDVLYIVR